MEIVERRIVKIINSIDRIIDADFQVSARELASLTGQIISTGPVVGNIGRIIVILFFLTPVLLEVEQLLTSTMILYATKCGLRVREVKVQRGGSCLLVFFAIICLSVGRITR